VINEAIDPLTDWSKSRRLFCIDSLSSWIKAWYTRSWF